MRGLAVATLASAIVIGAGCSLLFTFATSSAADGDGDVDGDGDGDGDVDGGTDAGTDAGLPCDPESSRGLARDACSSADVTVVDEAPGDPDDYATAYELLNFDSPGTIDDIPARIDTEGDSNWFKVTLPAGRSVLLYADGGINDEVDQEGVMAWIYREADAPAADLNGHSCTRNLGVCPLACSEGLSFTSLAFTSIEEATYYIRVAHDDSNDVGIEFTLCIAPTD